MLKLIKSLYSCLSSRERLRLAMVFLLVVTMALLELVSIGAIFPFMTLLVNPDAIETNAVLKTVYDFFGFTSFKSFIIFVGSILLGIFLLKGIISSLAIYAQLRYGWGRFHSFSVRLLKFYTSQSYLYYLTHDTSSLSKNVLAEARSIASGIILPMLQMLSQLVVAVFIIALILYMDPLLALMVFIVVGGMYTIIYLIIKHRLSFLGGQRFHEDEKRFKATNEAFGGFKEILIYGRRRHFVNAFVEPSKKWTNYTATCELATFLPKYAVEVVAFGGLLSMLLYMVAVRKDMSQIIPVMSVYAMAGYRLMPAAQLIMNGITAIRFHEPALKALYPDLKAGLEYEEKESLTVGGIDAKRLPLNSQIELHNISYFYPEAESPAVNGIDIKINKNSAVGFVGHSGCGKTTLINIILGLLSPSSGELRIDGLKIHDENIQMLRNNIGLVPQDVFISDDSLRNNVAFGVSHDMQDGAAIKHAIELASLEEYVQQLPDGLDTKLGEKGIKLSGGQKQRIGIARALYHDPEILIFDEATSALDGKTERTVIDSINKLRSTKTLIIVAHRFSTIQNCDEIFYLDKGIVKNKGTYKDLVSNDKDFEELAKASNTNDDE